MNERIVIIGGGHAAGQCAASLRQGGWTGPIMIAGDELSPPYQRPPLSKAYLAGTLTADRLLFRPAAFYEKERIDLRLGAQATAIDRTRRLVIFADGSGVAYDRLVLATGARVRRIACPGADLAGIGYVRTIADVDRLRAAFASARRLAIVGAGYIGLEVAAVAAKAGLETTVLEAAPRVMARVTGATVSAYFEALHRSRGVDLKLGVGVAGFAGERSVEAVRLADGEAIGCNLAIVGVGVQPNDEIAREAGLETADGIVVDDHTRTSDPDIFAIGDCTRHPSRYFGATLRLESVHNALEQAKTAAATLCGRPAPYDQVPWFWSDQYEVKLQTVGLGASRADAELVRGDPGTGSFSVYYLMGGRLIAVDSINAPGDHMIARRLLADGITPSSDDLQNPDVDLRSALAATAR